MSLDFELYGSDEDSTDRIYDAAKQRSPISAMFQLGEQSGQLFGAYHEERSARNATIR